MPTHFIVDYYGDLPVDIDVFNIVCLKHEYEKELRLNRAGLVFTKNGKKIIVPYVFSYDENKYVDIINPFLDELISMNKTIADCKYITLNPSRYYGTKYYPYVKNYVYDRTISMDRMNDDITSQILLKLLADGKFKEVFSSITNYTIGTYEAHINNMYNRLPTYVYMVHNSDVLKLLYIFNNRYTTITPKETLRLQSINDAPVKYIKINIFTGEETEIVAPSIDDEKREIINLINNGGDEMDEMDEMDDLYRDTYYTDKLMFDY